jgi:hypothetical protein
MVIRCYKPFITFILQPGCVIYRQVEDEQFHGCQANCVANCAVNGMIGISWDSEVMPQTSK